MIKSAKPEDPSKAPLDLVVGDKVIAKLGPTTTVCTIEENSPTELRWQGPPSLGLLGGIHSFYFLPSTTTPGGTTFKQKEIFTGYLAFLTRPGWPLYSMMGPMYTVLNKDLKARAESFYPLSK